MTKKTKRAGGTLLTLGLLAAAGAYMLVQYASGSSAPSPAPATAAANTAQPAPSTALGYKNGAYTGQAANAYYGAVQVQATVSGGKLANVQFLQYPNTHGTSVYINQQAMPMLTQEALSVQSANVNLISGATLTSEAFRQSLASALSQAQG